MQNLQMLQERIVVDTSEGKPIYLFAVGDKPTYIRLSATSYYLLKQRSLGISFTSLAAELSQGEKQFSPAEVEAAYHHVIAKIAKIEANPRLNHSGFLWRKTLIPQNIVIPIAEYLAIAFSKPIAYSLLGLIGFSIAIAPQQDLLLSTTTSDLLWAYLLLIISLLAHEFGHASACTRYGAKPSDIGFTLYLIWPAFYSDVTAAWQLKRWQRVVVDIGGVFFQLAIAALYVIIYSFTNWIPLKIALLAIAGSCLFTLNPVFKFDGYWIVSDALGVTNLSQQPLKILQYILARLRRRPIQPLPWSPLIIAILTIYTAISLGIWGYFLCIVLPLFGQVIIEYPALIKSLIIQLSISPFSVNSQQWQSFIGSTFTMIIVGLILYKLVQIILSLTIRLMPH
jgi:putative peptide zinc metalloprotease protein